MTAHMSGQRNLGCAAGEDTDICAGSVQTRGVIAKPASNAFPFASAAAGGVRDRPLRAEHAQMVLPLKACADVACRVANPAELCVRAGALSA